MLLPAADSTLTLLLFDFRAVLVQVTGGVVQSDTNWDGESFIDINLGSCAYHWGAVGQLQ